MLLQLKYVLFSCRDSWPSRAFVDEKVLPQQQYRHISFTFLEALILFPGVPTGLSDSRIARRVFRLWKYMYFQL